MKINIYLVLGIVVVIALFGILATLPVNETNDNTPSQSRVAPSKNALIANKGEELESEEKGVDKYSISLKSDKFTYVSDEKVNFTLVVESPEKTEDNEVQIMGVKNKYGSYKIKWKHKPDLEIGENVFSAIKKIPSCYGCSGISPGIYSVYAIIFDEDENQIINTSIEINITE